MKRVILESPFAGNWLQRWLNVRYARRCLRDALQRGEAPIASHLLYTQRGVLDDAKPAARQLGIDAGLAWKSVAQASVGESRKECGMELMPRRLRVSR